jgi:hypothetical protein
MAEQTVSTLQVLELNGCAIGTLFAQDIARRIEEVIKVDQTDDAVVRDEIREYVVTGSIQRSFNTLLDRYMETPNKPHEGIGVWVSGFFGSGKSSFAKYLGLGIEDRQLQGVQAASLLRERFRDNKASVLLQTINEKIPTHVVIFDVSSERGIRAGQSLTEITYLALLRSLGYAQNLDLAELEIALEEEKPEKLTGFKETFQALYPGQEWDKKKNLPVMAMNQASATLHRMDPSTYPSPDSWVKGGRAQADINARLLGERCTALIARRLPGRSLMFVIDEVGQFVARDVQKMLDLQAIVQRLGVEGQGKIWLVVTSQEKLTELVSGLDDRRVELARVMDRFPQELQVHLEPSDISEVTSRRVLEKNKAAEVLLHKLYEEHRSRLADCTRTTAEIKLPELTAQRFVDLYPLLPYQVELIINVVSGLRTQGGASKHVGGANRTIIKLAQQLLINPQVDLAHKEIGRLVTLENVYDLVSGNIESEVRGKINEIPRLVNHPLAQAVSKTICMLQFVKTVHRTAENIAAMLHPAVDADSRLPQVREALAELEKAMLVRKGDDGYRIPSPVEDDWERSRNALDPKVSERNLILAETLVGFWEPQPSQTLNGVKLFKAGLLVNGKEQVEGDLPVCIHLMAEGQGFRDQVEDLRRRSQVETFSIFWAAALTPAIDEEIVQFFRSKEILRLRERDARTPDQGHLVVEERHRLDRHREEVKRRLREALLSGSVFFRGNDRSPEGGAAVDATVKALLAQGLPEVYHRFGEAASRLETRDLQTLLSADSLQGLTPLFSRLHLLKEEGGKTVFAADQAPLSEVLVRIKNRTDYGESATGRYLEDVFHKEPFGWDFDMVKLLVLSLLRAGKIEATSGGKTFEDARSTDSKNTFNSNTAYRQASFRPKEGLDYRLLVQASDAFRQTFGKEAKELEQGKMAQDIRIELEQREHELRRMHTLLVRHGLPGESMLQEAQELVRDIRGGTDIHTIQAFRSEFRKLKDAFERVGNLAQYLLEPQVLVLQKAAATLKDSWPFLRAEPGLSADLTQAGLALEDKLGRESFFREIPEIERLGRKLQSAFEALLQEALAARTKAYDVALQQLGAIPGWTDLDEDQRRQIEEPLYRLAVPGSSSISIPQVRAEGEACETRLWDAQAKALQLLEGERVVSLRVGQFFQGGIETEEQLEAVLDSVRQACARLLAAGKKVVLQ